MPNFLHESHILVFLLSVEFFAFQTCTNNRWRLEIDTSLSDLKCETDHVMSLIHPSKTYMVFTWLFLSESTKALYIYTLNLWDVIFETGLEYRHSIVVSCRT